MARDLLVSRGYRVALIGGNYPVIDLIATGREEFRVSVKTSRTKHHVRLGRDTSVEQLQDNDFVFAFLPAEPNTEIGFEVPHYRLLTIPGGIARNDALAIHREYLNGKTPSGDKRKNTAGVMVKGYSRKPIHVTTWARWLNYEDCWDLLPAAV
ncbi:hypothetical protein [Hyphobacterium sp.]|uniref:hypothetical protein n=1 Tax=Hyphobacterium sp. TaxID=2004662 RepID=UPI003BAB5316